MNAPEEQVQQAHSVQLPKRWPLVSILQSRTSNLPVTKDSRLVNGIAEYDAGDKAWWVYKRPGMPSTPLGTTDIIAQGSYTYNAFGAFPVAGTQILSVANGKLYTTFVTLGITPTFFTGPATGPTLDSTAPYFFETINSSPQTVVLGNGVAAYIYTPSAGTYVKITDVNFPALFVPGWVYLDGFLYIMDTSGKIWGTAGQNNAAVWSGTNVILASSNADAGIALVKQLSYVIAMKQWTSQVFYDAGNATGSPLSVVPDSQLPLGAFAGSSVQEIDNTVIWLTSNQTASPQVVQMDNLTPKIVSTPNVEKLLSRASFTFFPQTVGTNAQLSPGIISLAWKHNGHRYYILTIVTLNITLVYDIDQKLWYFWTDVNGNYWPIQSICFFPPYYFSIGNGFPLQPGFHVAQATNGNLYPIDEAYTYPTDYGNIVPVDIYTPNLDLGTVRRKFLRALYFVGDKVSGSRLKVRFSDDDYQTWSNFVEVDMGLKKPRIGPCGTFSQRRAYHIRHQKATGLRLRDMDMQVDIGTL